VVNRGGTVNYYCVELWPSFNTDLAFYPPPEAEGYCFGVVRPSVRLSVRPSVRPSGTFVSGAISWKCFGGFHWNLVQVYIRIRGWCTPNGIVHHLLKTELWPFISWKNAFYYRHLNAFYYRHFCVRSHILEVLWRISLKLGMSIYPPPEAEGYCFGVVRPSGCPSGTFVSGAISWKCFDGFHWNLI